MPREPRPMQSVIDQIDAAVKELRKETQKKGASPEVLRKQLLRVQAAAAAGIRTVDADDSRKNQLNPNNDAFWRARGFPKRPPDWKARLTVKK